jgi:hypothetical protein
LKLLCFGAFLSGVLGRLAVPLGLFFLVLLAFWTVFGPLIVGLLFWLRNPRRLLLQLGFKKTAHRIHHYHKKKAHYAAEKRRAELRKKRELAKSARAAETGKLSSNDVEESDSSDDTTASLMRTMKR